MDENQFIAYIHMRVSMQYQSFPDPCGAFSYGEVEDDTLNIE